MNDLSQSLIDAAAEAVRNELIKFPQDSAKRWGTDGQIAWGATEYDIARVAVSSALETLAKSGQIAWAESLAGLAAEVRGQS